MKTTFLLKPDKTPSDMLCASDYVNVVFYIDEARGKRETRFLI